MKNQSKGLTVLFIALALCAAVGIVWLTISNLVVALTTGLQGGLGGLFDSLPTTSPLIIGIGICAALAIIFLTFKSLVPALTKGLKGGATGLNDVISSINNNKASDSSENQN